MLCYQEVGEDPILSLREDKMLLADLLNIRKLTKLLDVILLFNLAKVNVVGDPHVLERLQEEALLKLPLGEEPYKELLLEIEGQ